MRGLDGEMPQQRDRSPIPMVRWPYADEEEDEEDKEDEEDEEEEGQEEEEEMLQRSTPYFRLGNRKEFQQRGNSKG